MPLPEPVSGISNFPHVIGISSSANMAPTQQANTPLGDQELSPVAQQDEKTTRTHSETQDDGAGINLPKGPGH